MISLQSMDFFHAALGFYNYYNTSAFVFSLIRNFFSWFICWLFFRLVWIDCIFVLHFCSVWYSCRLLSGTDMYILRPFIKFEPVLTTKIQCTRMHRRSNERKKKRTPCHPNDSGFMCGITRLKRGIAVYVEACISYVKYDYVYNIWPIWCVRWEEKYFNYSRMRCSECCTDDSIE